ncbi:helix-turn-helix domain-containing protein [Streptomyces bacillaris]|uniref:helix-turn-helix domain-containing protein n=1 Tax=Streptomyces bacillaris TaxID=68179 RepID=UPI0036C180F9
MSGDADGGQDSGSQGSGTQDTGSQDTGSESGRGGGRESGRGSSSRATDDVLDAVGPRLRALRRRRGITLAELAAETGISESTLSRLESGRRRATLELLLPLARRYDVPLDDLVGAPRTGDPRIHLKPVRRFGMIFVPLSRRPGGIHAFKMIIPARPEPLAPTPQTHEGQEWVYVLSGRLRLVLGDRDLVLPPGEAAEFDTSLPHWLGSADGGAVELLILFGPHGMRAHVRADPSGPDADPDPDRA